MATANKNYTARCSCTKIKEKANRQFIIGATRKRHGNEGNQKKT
jgi:hypothetical protein